MLWLVKIWQVSSCGNLYSTFLKKTCNTLIAEADRVLCQLVMFLTVFFPLEVQNEIQLLSRVFCYSWLLCLLNFCLRNVPLVKVGNPIPDGIVFIFHLTGCVRGLKSLKRFWHYLIAFRSCISNGKRQVQKSDRINSDRQSGSDQLGSTRTNSDRIKK